ncbi:MAG: FAD-dependent oxidoreductase [Candidatus Eisenbacteria bacterium]|jgi:protoporphyrinogen oxidase|nr:FAD-dependent oxidoreductase [Candidatus Eisenbacteria bacterium]
MNRLPNHADTIVIGAGITGLCLARSLATQGVSVALLEAAGAPGGLLAPKLLNGVSVDSYYHHIFVSDLRTRRLLDGLDLTRALAWRTTSVSLLDEAGFHPLTSPLDILRFKELSLGEKVRLALLVRHARSIEPAGLDDVLARKWAVSLAGPVVWERFLRPLVEAKFGAAAPRVSAAWLAGRIGCRSNRGLRGERLGYLTPSFHALVSRLAGDLEPVLWCSEPVEGIVIEGGRVTAVSAGTQTVTCRDVVFTGGANALAKILAGMDDLLPDLASLAFQGILCGVFAVDSPSRGAYWTNVTVPGAPFNIVVQQDLLEPVKGGRGIVYASRYVDPETARAAHRERELDAMQEGLRAYFGIDPSAISDRELAVTDDAGIVYATGTRAVIDSLRPSVSGFHVAGMLTSFPDRSIEQSVAGAEDLARALAGA